MREDFKKQLRAGAKSPRLIPGMQVADPKRRLIIMASLVVLLLFAASMLEGFSKRPESVKTTKDAPATRKMPGAPRFSGVPTLDRTFIDTIKDSTAKEQEAWDEEAIAYLLTEAANTPAVTAYTRKLLPVNRASAAVIAANAKAWRFRFVRFRGELEYKKEGDYADLSNGGSGDIGRAHLGRVRIDGDGPPVRVVFITPLAPFWKDHNSSAVAPESKIIKDGYIRGRGIFVKKYRDVGPDGEEVDTLLVVATSIKRDFKELPVTSLESIPFQIIQDHIGLMEDRDGRRVLFKTYPKPLFRLLRWAIPRSGPEGKALREKEGLKARSIEDPLDYEDLVSNPMEHRATYVGALGALAWDPLYVGPEDIEDDKANDAGISEYITGWAVTDKDRLVWWVAPAKFGTLGLKRRSRIYFAGYFYKTKGYQARDGSDRVAPMLVLTEMRVIVPAKPDHTVELFIAAGFIAGISLLVFIIVREDKTKQDYRRLRRKQVV